MVPPIPLDGQRFDRLVVLRRVDNDRFGKARWLCRCDCGKETITRSNTLRKGETRSCGCLHLETVKVNNRTHGAAHSLLYNVWSSMKGRCNNPTDQAYPRYGGRGIKVCPAWEADFTQFAKDMGPRLPHASIDRIDNEGDYTPENCRWATQKEQMRNTRINIWLTFRGETLTMAEWAERQGLEISALHWRVREAGWSIERALTTPSTPPKGEQHPGCKLTNEDIEAIRTAFSSGTPQAALTRQYGVSQSHISRIVKGKVRKRD